MITLVDEFEILGVPAPQGSKTRMPNGAMLDGKSPAARAKHRAWRTAVAQVARDVAGETPHDGPLQLQVTFRLPMPQSRPARARHAGIWPHFTKPDIDKLLRTTLDGLEDGGLIRDDSHICAIEVEAWEVIGWTGALITLRQIDVDECSESGGDGWIIDTPDEQLACHFCAGDNGSSGDPR